MQLPRCRAAQQTRRCWGVKASAGEDTHPALVPTGVVSHMQHQPVLMLPDTVSNACAGKATHAAKILFQAFASGSGAACVCGMVRHACAGWATHAAPSTAPVDCCCHLACFGWCPEVLRAMHAAQSPPTCAHASQTGAWCVCPRRSGHLRHMRSKHWPKPYCCRLPGSERFPQV